MIKTTSKQIVDYWKENWADHGIGVKWEDATEYCWRCSYKRRLQRCHIIPASLGGKDEPSNMVLLCKTCHSEGPNVEDPEIMWEWIGAYQVPKYNTFWLIQGMKEYESIYGTSVEQDLGDVLALAGVGEMPKEDISQYIEKAVHRSSIHFGQAYPNSATIAGVLRIMVKTIAGDYSVRFPIMRDEQEY